MYTIDGGASGKGRLDVLARVCKPGTSSLFDREGVPTAGSRVDIGCGGTVLRRSGVPEFVNPTQRWSAVPQRVRAAAIALLAAVTIGISSLASGAGTGGRPGPTGAAAVTPTETTTTGAGVEAR